MTAVTALSLGERTLAVVSGRRNGAGLELVRSSIERLPEGFAAKTPGERAAVLRELLVRAGGAPGRVAVVVPRADALLRELELPAGTPEEIHQMVRFQVERELPMAVDQVRYSYLASPGATGKTRVAVAAVPVERLGAVMGALEGAGCRVQDLFVSSFGLAGLAPSEGRCAVVGFGEGTVEILIVEGGTLAQARSVPMKEVSAEALAAEINRSVLSWKAHGTDRDVARVVIAGEGAEAVEEAAALKGRVSWPVETLALDGAVRREAGVELGPGVAAAAGVCLSLLRGRPAMPNILRPPEIRRTLRLAAWERLAALGAAALLLLFFLCRAIQSNRLERRDDLAAEREAHEKPMKALNELRARTELAAQWLGTRYPWIETFDAIQGKIDRAKLWITLCEVQDSGAMRLEGKAVQGDLVNALITELQKHPSFKRVDPDYTRPSQDKGAYKVSFAIKIELAGLEPLAKPRGGR